LFLAADHAFDVEAVISCPRTIHPAFGVFVGAADFVTVAAFVVVGFVVAAAESLAASADWPSVTRMTTGFSASDRALARGATA
ncbi:MAG: hypothetical protein ACPHWU_01140, partial [Marinobacter vinifirmus]